MSSELIQYRLRLFIFLKSQPNLKHK